MCATVCCTRRSNGSMRDPSETDPHKIGPPKLWLGAGVGCTLSPHAKKERLLKETLLDSTLKGVVADILLLHSCFLKRVFYHTSGDLTKSSEQSRGRVRDHQAESGKKWTHKGNLEGGVRQKDPLV